MTPLTVPEARAILLADEGLSLSFDARLAAGLAFGFVESTAWVSLVVSARTRIALFEGRQDAR